jgi:hypothetical protein
MLTSCLWSDFGQNSATGKRSELDNPATVTFRRSAFGYRSETSQRFSLCCHLQPQFTACFGLAIERLSDRCRAANVAQKQDLNLKIAALGSDLEELANPDFACRLHRYSVALNSAEFARARGQSTRLKEPGCPEPFVYSYTGHARLNIAGLRVCMRRCSPYSRIFLKGGNSHKVELQSLRPRMEQHRGMLGKIPPVIVVCLS